MSDLGRFTEASLFILVWLSERPKHGQAITTDVEAMTGKPMGPGSLQGGLARLGRRRLIEALDPDDRRPYERTDRATTLETQVEAITRPRKPVCTKLSWRSA